MNNGRSVNVRANLRPAFAGRGAGSLLEIDAWIQSEIKAISPLLERLMRLIEGSHCITGEESAVELALREALNNAVFHTSAAAARSARESLSLFQTRVKGLIRARFLIPCQSIISKPSTDVASIS